MKVTLRLTAVTLAAGATLAIAGAPLAAAAQDPQLVCTEVGAGNTQCESPGNAQLSASPPDVGYQTPYPFLYGGAVIVHDAPGGHGMR
jgi:hypothetical protein